MDSRLPPTPAAASRLDPYADVDARLERIGDELRDVAAVARTVDDHFAHLFENVRFAVSAERLAWRKSHKV